MRFDVELIIAGRDVVEREVSVCVGDCAARNTARLACQQRNIRAAHNRAIRIFHGSGDLAVGFLAERDKRQRAREKSNSCIAC